MSAPANRSRAFSRSLVVDEVPDHGLDREIKADSGECAAVAREIDLPSIGALVASFRISRRSAGALQVEGNVVARVTQTCVVSLEPFESEIAQEIEAVFAPVAGAAPERDGRRRQAYAPRPRDRIDVRDVAPVASIDAGETDPPDPIVDGRIDLGALAVEFLVLGLDPHPKKPGVHFTDVVIGESDAPEPSAFAALGRLKDRS